MSRKKLHFTSLEWAVEYLKAYKHYASIGVADYDIEIMLGFLFNDAIKEQI